MPLHRLPCRIPPPSWKLPFISSFLHPVTARAPNTSVIKNNFFIIEQFKLINMEIKTDCPACQCKDISFNSNFKIFLLLPESFHNMRYNFFVIFVDL